MAGPHLTNQITGILIKFREEKVAFVIDIGQMLLQFFDSNELWNRLCFLWWQDGDLEKSLAD